MKERERSGEIKNDLIDILVQLKNEDKDKISTNEEIGKILRYTKRKQIFNN